MVRKFRLPILFAAALLMAVAALGSSRLQVASASPEQQTTTFFSYSVKFVCGTQPNANPNLAVTQVGTYATDINIHNYSRTVDAQIRKEVILLVANGNPIGREPAFMQPTAFDGIVLPPNTATMDDCSRIWTLLGAAPGSYFVGFFEILSTIDLSIDAVYTVRGQNGNTDIDVERVQAKRVTF